MKIIIDMPTKELADEVEEELVRQDHLDEEKEDNLMDKYRDVGMSPLDFIDKEFV